MKDQYFGDINDYRKYGLLRALIQATGFAMAVCWMRTAPDGRSDGSKIAYLNQPDQWRQYDPPLFDFLRQTVASNATRSLNMIENSSILSRCGYFNDFLTDDPASRRQYFEAFTARCEGRELLFFDPDNGLEVKSAPYGKRSSSKYLYWHEVERFYRRGHSLLIYQHYPRVKRRVYADALAAASMKQISVIPQAMFSTPHVLFLALCQKGHEDLIAKAGTQVSEMWSDQIVLIDRRERIPN
ncbi:hypothetical protein ACFL6M_02965 [Candidatus Eisenbacteria bacterium]|uniref:Uncharacterized protein n=1 Tax=Eiseniibacteriota bacterium TaxID=2212470 RepID=A0ABV6YK44_UNCEI